MIDWLYDLVDRLREINRYAIASVLFLLWMLTLADVDLMRMIETHQERSRIESKLAEHQKNIDMLQEELQRMAADSHAKERLAREAYYMHRPDEDVFVFR